MSSTAVKNPIADEHRLATLRGTGLLDAPPSEAFDRLTRLATQLLHVPVALVSLVDDDRQFFVSCRGLEEPWASARQTPHSHSFCQYVVSRNASLVIEDARKVDFLKTNLAIRDLGVIAYAGIPLRLSTGEVLGSFCAIDTEPRHWAEADLESLQTLADAAMAEMDLRETTKLLDEREQQLAVLLDNSEELVCSFGDRGRIIYVNRAWRETLGYSADEAASLRVLDLVSPEHRESFRAVVEELRAGNPVPFYEAELVAKNGRLVRCRGRAMPTVHNGKVTRIDALFFDITAATAAEKARAEADRMKNELIGLVSHELRSPLTTIQGALRLMTAQVETADPRTKKLADLASRGTDRLLRLVDDLLDIERFEAGVIPLARQTVAAAGLLEDAREAVAGAAESAGVSVAIEPGSEAVTVSADPDRLVQVLVNLAANAIKFSRGGGTVTMSAAREGAATHFAVRDAGRGIPPEMLESIFERFQQVEPDDAAVKRGAGLGLAICRAIVTGHGGRVWAENNDGAGATFHVIIPDAA
jgi:PAS domain S-box-containing protein